MLKLTYIANYYNNIFNLYNQLKNLLLYRNVEYLLIIFNYKLNYRKNNKAIHKFTLTMHIALLINLIYLKSKITFSFM